ncbi:XRE family transcriptional regulator [Paenibacillus sp. 1011MAR3C5]|uniref:helix-turn-helix domain-containing protein n=1 Tax=Paenibacillus sp. 1011MAR3C5 TaxID=1675787 RepID=UPI000E6C80DE|nr:helix-turn-helix transcriptional regulator [Paenibacillus sp. 1011MAR3C5]RJE88711.1 XRE family transcriptional regulator [Paenibacillus sp. 1011MAR3C5]
MKHRKEPPGDKNIIGSRVLKMRKAKGMKQKEFLARLQTLGLDISPTSLSRLEGQHRLVQDYEILIIAKALEISVGELLGEKT